MTLNTDFILRTGAFDEKKILFTSNEEMQKYALKKYNKLKSSISESRFEKVVTGSDDFSLILWDPLASNKPIMRMTGHRQLVNHVSFSPDTYYLASGSFDKCIKIWNGHNGNFLFNFRGHVGAIYQLAWSSDSRLLISVSKDSTVKCWSLKRKRLLYDLPGHADEVSL
jgi:ribosome assembly protein 4